MSTVETAAPSNFIRAIIDEDLASGKHQTVVTRFPPEPNGYLHIGHAKAICLNFGLAQSYGGTCHLRMDDTNPIKEEQEYIDAIVDDVRWLGFDWGDKLYYASDYFEQMYQYAVDLIKQGKAYVCDLTADQVRETRGTLTEPGQDSPYRNRSVEENLELFARMRAGEFPDGAKTLRAKIDMASPNINLRDPAMYRIRHANHPRTGDTWCIYPIYDYAHCLEDALEKITHSICTLEFEDRRPLYDWYLDQLDVPAHPQQIEFARLSLTNTVMSKRILLGLVQSGLVKGWDDPRMPTIAGFRRRGYTPAAIRDFAERIGVAKADNLVDVALLEHCIRDDLNQQVKRAMAVLNPLKVVITNLEQDEEIEAPYFPDDPPRMGSRRVPFTREIYIERDDFMEEPPSKFFRLAPGREVRLRWAYFIQCHEVIKDADGEIVELRCTYDPATKGGNAPDGRKVKGTIHWVSANDSVEAEVRLYDRLFSVPNVAQAIKQGSDYKDLLNPGSLDTVQARVERSLADAKPWDRFQFERQGYFMVDPKDSLPGKLVFNRIVPLKDSWAKLVQAGKTS